MYKSPSMIRYRATFSAWVSLYCAYIALGLKHSEHDTIARAVWAFRLNGIPCSFLPPPVFAEGLSLSVWKGLVVLLVFGNRVWDVMRSIKNGFWQLRWLAYPTITLSTLFTPNTYFLSWQQCCRNSFSLGLLLRHSFALSSWVMSGSTSCKILKMLPFHVQWLHCIPW